MGLRLVEIQGHFYKIYFVYKTIMLKENTAHYDRSNTTETHKLQLNKKFQ